MNEANPLEINLKLPLPPTVNKQYATVGNRRVLSWSARSYKEYVYKELRRLYISGQISLSTVDTLRQGFISLSLIFYFKTALGRDLDGGLKITQDALCEALQINDNRVVEVYLSKKVNSEDPHVEAIIKPAGSWDFKGCLQTGESERFDLTLCMKRKERRRAVKR